MPLKGNIRVMESLGRLTIPSEIRKNLKIQKGTPMHILIDGNKVILEKFNSTCDFCQSLDWVEFKGGRICLECLEELEKAKDLIKKKMGV